MRWALLLLLLTVRARSRAGPPQEQAPGFHLAPGRFPGSSGSAATASPCKGLLAEGTTSATLTNRGLKSLPDCLPDTLQRLDLSFNQVSVLNVTLLSSLTQLRQLTLHHNSLTGVLWGMRGLPGLLSLDLSYNKLTQVPQWAWSRPTSLRTLSLAGNPLLQLPFRAFSCFPELEVLDLSSTQLGFGGQMGILWGAFLQRGNKPLAKLQVLDLSGTYLQQIESRWLRDLPNLTRLYLKRMPRLRTLEGDIFKMTPRLEWLDCSNSLALTSVHTHIFQDTPSLQVLVFQNCNLSSFPPWTVQPSQRRDINLFGNPLTCSCELSWLFLDMKTTSLVRAADTMCTPAAGSREPFSAPLLLSQLPDMCRLNQSTNLQASSQPAGGQPAVTRASTRFWTMGRWHGQLADSTPLDDGPPVILLDDDSVEEPTEKEAPAVQHERCDYDLCRHLQTPCAELQRNSLCTCPGLTGEDTVPNPPRLEGVSEVTDTSVLIHWCAPYSVVHTYQIHYSMEGDEGNQSVGDIYATARQHPLYRLSPGTTYRVCVVAANAAGLSQLQPVGWRQPCTTVTTKPSSVVILVVLGTVCGLLLISTLVLSVCLCRPGRKLCGHNHNSYIVSFKNPYPMPLENPGQEGRQSTVVGVLPGICEAPSSMASNPQRQENPAFDPTKLKNFY